MKQTMEIKKENGEIIKMELVIAGAANLTEMQIVKVNKFNEEAKIGYYTVNNDTDEAMLGIYVKQEKDVTKAYGAAKARNGIAYITATKTSSTMKHYKSAKFMEKALKAYELTLEEVKNAMETLKAATITNNMVDVSEYAVSTESQEVAVQAEITNANNASEKASKAPFSDEEAALLDKIEKATADNILLQHGNHEAAHQATLDREAAEAELGKLAMEAHKSGNDKHFKLLFNEMQARIELGTKFGSENESAAGQYVRGELTYKPFGNRSIIAEDNDVADKVTDIDKSPTEVMLEELAKGFGVVIKTYGETRKIETVTVATLKEAFDIVEKPTEAETAYEIYDRHNEQTIYFCNTIGREYFYIVNQEVDRDEFGKVYEMGAADDNDEKLYTACFCTFNGDDDDVTSSFDTESKDFKTAQEAYEACRHFINTCGGYIFAGCYIEHWTDNGCKTIFNCTCENLETFYIDGNEVEFDAFNANYHVYAPKFTVELDELFRDYEDKSYEVYQAEYFQNRKAFDAGIATRSKISNAIWEAKENYTERYGGEISEEITHCTERAQARFDNWKSNYEMIQKMKAEGKGITKMVAALNGANIDETQNVQAQTDSNSASQNDDPIVMQFAKVGLKVSYIDEYFIYKAKEKNRNKEFFKHKKWAEYAESFNYQLPIIEKRDKNDKPRYYYQPAGNNGLQSVSRANAAMLVADGLAFIKRESGYIIINRGSTKSIPQNWIDEMATADERAAEQDKKDKADYENRIEVTKSNIERTFSENNFTPEQVQAFKAIYNYEFAATVKEHTGSKAINYDELKAQHDAAQQRLRDDSQWAYYAEEFRLFADLRGMITDYSSLGQLEAVYSIYWGDIKATKPREADVNDYFITPAAQEVAIKAEETVTDNTKYQDTADESPMFYMNDTSNRTATDKRAPFTTVVELENGDEREQFFDAGEAMNHVKKIAAENPTAECQIEDADGDMIYEDDKIQIRYYDTEGNEVDYDTFLKTYLALGIKSDCEQSSILTA